MRKLKIERNVIIFTAIIAIAVLELLVLLPLEVSRIVAVQKKISGIKRNLVTIETDWPNKDTYIRNQEAIREAIVGTHGKFVSPQEASNLFSFISSGGKKFNVEIKVLNPADLQEYASTKAGKIKYLPITISLQSSFHNLARFLEYLQTSQYFFEVKELKIGSGFPTNAVEMVLCGLVKTKE
ncbi:MAG: hypothetical protein WCI77_05035 [Candidatus Omnitrophota bacterium]